MRELSSHAVLSMSDSTMAVSSKCIRDLSVQIVFFIVSLFLLLGFNLSYIVDLFAGLHELASASACTLLKLASSVARAVKTLQRHLKMLKLYRGILERGHYCTDLVALGPYCHDLRPIFSSMALALG